MKRLPYRKTWDIAFANYLKTLREEKPVIVTGDFNVAHQPIDLARPKENYNKTSGYTQDEIDGMNLILDQGFLMPSGPCIPIKHSTHFGICTLKHESAMWVGD